MVAGGIKCLAPIQGPTSTCNRKPNWTASMTVFVCLSARVTATGAAVSLTSDVVAQNNEGDHLSVDRKWFYSFLYPFSLVLVYCSHSFEFPLPIPCAPRPWNGVMYSDVQPANHNSSSPLLLFLSFLLSSSCTLFPICWFSFCLPSSAVLSAYFFLLFSPFSFPSTTAP